MCYPLPEQTTETDMYQVIGGFFIENYIIWSNCCGLSTEQSQCQAVSLQKAHAKEVAAPHVAWSHCCIHKRALACKDLPEGFKAFLVDAVNVVNYIKSQALKLRLFTSLYEDMGSLHSNLFIILRWLSRGQVLQIV